MPRISHPPRARNRLARQLGERVHVERLLVATDVQRPGRFSARLKSTGELVTTSTRQPLVDGARELLARGFDPATLLTMRHVEKDYDSFRPAPIGEWAKWTYHESETRPLRRERWEAYSTAADRMPIADAGETPKSGDKPLAGVPGHPELEAAL